MACCVCLVAVQPASQVLGLRMGVVSCVLLEPFQLVATKRHADPALMEHDPTQEHQTLCSAPANLAMALATLTKSFLVRSYAANVWVVSGALGDSTLCASPAPDRRHMTSVQL